MKHIHIGAVEVQTTFSVQHTCKSCLISTELNGKELLILLSTISGGGGSGLLRAVCGAGTRARERAHHPPQFYFYWFTNSLQSSLSEALLFIQFHFIKFDNWHYKAEETLSFVAGRMKTSGHVATSSCLLTWHCLGGMALQSQTARSTQ